MITKEQYIESLVSELEIIKHLGTKVEDKHLSHKPTDKQRTVAETMHYLGYVFVALVESIYKGDTSLYMKHLNETGETTIENFGSKIDMQIEKIKEYVGAMSEDDMKQEFDMYGIRTKAMHLLHAIKNASAYKMQLFLFLKQSGREELNTYNLWAGKDGDMK